MSLKTIYQRFLANPDASVFAPDGSLSYITTLTTLHKPDIIAKHFTAHQRVLRKKNEKVLSAIEGDDALCLETETTIEFIQGGGAYLPGLDDNFLVDRVVTIPIIHVVHFNEQQKIQQLRLFWDQGSLLKQMEIIGARGRNWPIRDGKDHVKLIASSAAAASPGVTSRPTTTNGSGHPSEVVITSKPTEPRKTATRDPHASLSLFQGRDDDYEASQIPTITAPRGSARPPQRDWKDLFSDNGEDPASAQPPTSPKKGVRPGSKDQSAKPPPRDYHDLFVGEGDGASPSSKARSASPQKESIAPKAGAGKNFQPNRLFEDIGEQPATPGANSPEKARKPHPKKFEHFDFGDEPTEQSQQKLPARPRTQHQSQWDFGDTSAPAKAPQKIRSQDVRHFGWGDDDSAHESPAKNKNVPQPRPDAKSNFDFLDDGSPAVTNRIAGRGHASDRGAGLYKSSLLHEQDTPSATEKNANPLSTVTNLKDRHKDFDPHFAMADATPSGAEEPRFLAQSRATGKENKGIKLGGDGMGGRKDAARNWGFGDESDEDGKLGANGGKFHPGKKQQAPKDNDFWDY